jgi:sigma-B regulation protein RsbU (phosphoserine phosphatase)
MGAESKTRPAKLNLPWLPPGAGERRRVLVVDDEPGMRYMARRVLEGRFEVREAPSGEAALRLLEEETIHFAIVDIRLPGLSGLELLSAIKNCCPGIDVIVMTGSATDPDEALEDAVRRKAFFFLRKPFPMSILETLADRVVENQELEEQVVLHVRTLERDLESARIFQKQLLPPPSWEGKRIRVASRLVASERLSGDFIDYWTLPDGGTALFVADVMGHGPSSAMITGMVKGQLRAAAAELDEPGEMLAALEGGLPKLATFPFVTAFLVLDRPERGELVFCGAGHPPIHLGVPEGARGVDAVLGHSPAEGGPATVVGGHPPAEGDGGAGWRIQELPSRGLPINTGIRTGHRESLQVPREPGLRLFLSTDGYREARNPEGRFYDDPGEEPDSPFLRAVDQALLAGSPEDGLTRLEAAWSSFTGGVPGDDDRAAVIAWIL